MLYSFATAQAAEVYAEVDRFRTGGTVHAVYMAMGPHLSALSEEALQHFDFVIIREGEESLLQLILPWRAAAIPPP